LNRIRDGLDVDGSGENVEVGKIAGIGMTSQVSVASRREGNGGAAEAVYFSRVLWLLHKVARLPSAINLKVNVRYKHLPFLLVFFYKRQL